MNLISLIVKPESLPRLEMIMKNLRRLIGTGHEICHFAFEAQSSEEADILLGSEGASHEAALALREGPVTVIEIRGPLSLSQVHMLKKQRYLEDVFVPQGAEESIRWNEILGNRAVAHA